MFKLLPGVGSLPSRGPPVITVRNCSRNGKREIKYPFRDPFSVKMCQGLDLKNLSTYYKWENESWIPNENLEAREVRSRQPAGLRMVGGTYTTHKVRENVNMNA